MYIWSYQKSYEVDTIFSIPKWGNWDTQKLNNLLISHIGKKKKPSGHSLAVQWLILCISTAGSMGSTPGERTKIPYVPGLGQEKKKKPYS